MKDALSAGAEKRGQLPETSLASDQEQRQIGAFTPEAGAPSCCCE